MNDPSFLRKVQKLTNIKALEKTGLSTTEAMLQIIREEGSPEQVARCAILEKARSVNEAVGILLELAFVGTFITSILIGSWLLGGSALGVRFLLKALWRKKLDGILDEIAATWKAV